MTVTFKQFATYLAAPDDATITQLDEIWDRILGKKKADKEAEEEEDDKKSTGSKVMSRKDLDDKRKELAAKRKKELEDKRNQAWAAAKDRAETGGRSDPKDGKGAHRTSEFAWHSSHVKEGKESYSEEGYWKDDAKAAGYKVKKLSGNLDDGDQTWGAFKDDKKVGEFTEKEEGRGGWLMTESVLLRRHWLKD